MKKIGIIGGLSWESTIEYYRVINTEVQRVLGGLHSASLIMESYDFDRIATLQKNERWEDITQILIESANKLILGGAEVIVIATNTLHKLVPFIQPEISVPIFHIADATAKEILEQGYSKILLLVTKYTMQEDFYKEKLKNDYNISVLTPTLEEQDFIHYLIFEELCQGIIAEETRNKVLQIIDEYKEQGAQAVVLGCTELPNLIKKSSLPVLDTAKIHSLGVVDYAITKKIFSDFVRV